jgi:hypothetical protein
MNIGEAIAALKNEKSVRRAGWNGKGMELYLENQLSHTIPGGIFKGIRREYAPVVCLVTPKGIHQPGWVCSQEDLLANDWEIVA